MLKPIRNALYRTTLLATPFMLAACGPDDGTNKFEIVVLPLLFFTVSLAYDWLKTRSLSTARVAG